MAMTLQDLAELASELNTSGLSIEEAISTAETNVATAQERLDCLRDVAEFLGRTRSGKKPGRKRKPAPVEQAEPGTGG